MSLSIGRVAPGVALAAGVVLSFAGAAHPPTTPARTAGGPPRLIVLVVIDQFRADALARHGDRFGPGGFRRLRREGAEFAACFWPHAPTETAPAHATLATGTTPDRHGIAGNSLCDGSGGPAVPAVEDPGSPLVGAAPGLPGASPRNLIGTTFADELRLFTGGAAKVFGLALKDRAAIFSTGHAANGAFWYDARAGTMISSRHYGERLPESVAAFNARRPADRYHGRDFTVEGRVVARLSGASGQPDGAFYERLVFTPFIHDYLLDFARVLIEQEGLGADATPDFLFIGLSGHDWLGHESGPYDPAIAAMAARTDAQIADLLAFLDRRPGRGAYWLVLTADHGVAPPVRQAAALGAPARGLDPQAVAKTVGEALSRRFGAADLAGPCGHWDRLTFDRAALARRGAGLDAAIRTAGEAALGVSGVLGYVGARVSSLDRATTEAYRLGRYPSRSPDLIIVPEPFVLLTGGDAALHGSPHAYDAHVPLILYGPPFRPGRYFGRVSPADVAPTLAAILGMTPPARASGRVLDEALAEARPD